MVDFHLPIPPALVHKIIFTIPTNTPFLSTSVILHLFIFTYTDPNNIFPAPAISTNSGCTKEPGC